MSADGDGDGGAGGRGASLTATGAACVDAMHWWDLDEVVAIESETFGPTAWTLADFYSEMAADNRWCRVARMPGGIAGYVIVSQVGHDADLMTIAVGRRWRGTGVGRQLLGAALGRASKFDAWQMFLEVADGNSAVNLYRRNGFEAIGRRRRYYPDGADAIIMRRAFPPGGHATMADEGVNA